MKADSLNYVREFPRVIRIEPAGACNLRCSHCPTGTVNMERGIMKWDVFEKVFASIQGEFDKVKVIVLYHGGEPLLNKHFPRMVTKLKEAGIPFVKTVSNGMLLTEAAAKEILSSGLDAIEFSLDGQNPTENEFIRRRSEFRTVVTNIKRFLDLRRASGSRVPTVHLSSTQFLTSEQIQSGNHPESPDAPDYLKREFGPDYLGEMEGFKCTYAMRWPHMEVIGDYYKVEYDPHDHEKSGCDHVLNTMTVRWNGDVVACCYDLTSEFVIGNTMQATLSEIWNNDRYRMLRESIEKRKFVKMCNNCNTVRPNAYLVMRPELREKLRGNASTRPETSESSTEKTV